MLPDVTETTITVPPEWALLKAVWTAWPADADEWNGDLETPRRDVAAMVRALSEATTVRLLVNGAEAEASARAALGGVADFAPARYGDIWLRDTGPIFARTHLGRVALRFATTAGAANMTCRTMRPSWWLRGHESTCSRPRSRR